MFGIMYKKLEHDPVFFLPRHIRILVTIRIKFLMFVRNQHVLLRRAAKEGLLRVSG